MDNRSEADKTAGMIPVPWGSDDGKGRIVRIRTLKRRKAATWRTEAVAGLMGLAGGDLERLDDLSRTLSGISELELDALLSYDQDQALGSREWIEDHVDDSQVHAALRAVLEVAFPFVNDLRGALREIGSILALRGQVEGSQPASSTNGASPSGDLTPIT
jgi:hypothetical protein